MKDDLTANLNALNEAQRAPTLHKDGPLIVIAGAGSGKTGVNLPDCLFDDPRSGFLFYSGFDLYQ